MDGGAERPRYSTHRVAVAERDGTLVGIAMSGPAEDEQDPVHLYVLYVLARWHGFVRDGVEKVDDTLREVHMTRAGLV